MANGPARDGDFKDVADQAQQAILQVAGRAKDEVADRIDGSKHLVADSIGNFASGLRKASKHLQKENEKVAPEALSAVAQRIDSIGKYLRQRDLAELAEDAENFARRNPGLVIGGAFAAGLLATRFLKSSAKTGRVRTARRKAEPAASAPPRKKTGTTGD